MTSRKVINLFIIRWLLARVSEKQYTVPQFRLSQLERFGLEKYFCVVIMLKKGSVSQLVGADHNKICSKVGGQ